MLNPRSLVVFATLALVIATATGAPAMYYKLNDQEKFELDLVPISSTVIPLHEITVGAGSGAAPAPKALSNHELKRILMKHHLNGEDPHELVTVKREKSAAKKKIITKEDRN